MSVCETVLVLGGARSGKSRFAEAWVTRRPSPWIYVATAEARDGEMRERIAHHRARRGEGWTTVEAPLDLVTTLERYAVPGTTVLVDCLTLWLTNLMLAQCDVEKEAENLVAALDRLKGGIAFVSNEVGLGLVPETPLGREFRDQAGRLHQILAARVDSVVLMVAGLPMHVKGPDGGSSGTGT